MTVDDLIRIGALRTAEAFVAGSIRNASGFFDSLVKRFGEGAEITRPIADRLINIANRGSRAGSDFWSNRRIDYRTVPLIPRTGPTIPGLPGIRREGRFVLSYTDELGFRDKIAVTIPDISGYTRGEVQDMLDGMLRAEINRRRRSKNYPDPAADPQISIVAISIFRIRNI